MAKARIVYLACIAFITGMFLGGANALAQENVRDEAQSVAEAQQGLEPDSISPETASLPETTPLPDSVPEIVDASSDEWLMLTPSATLQEVYEDGEGGEYLEAYDIEEENVDENVAQDLPVEADDQTAELRLPNPEYSIESIHVSGNTYTSRKRILELMALDDDIESLRMTLEELEDCRVRLALTGRFDSVEMKLRPGNTSSSLRIDINVDDRSPIQINQYYVGTDSKSSYWHGLDVSWLSLFSPLHRMRAVYAATSSNDYTLDVSYYVPSIADLPLSMLFNVHTMNGHEGVYGPTIDRRGSRNYDFEHIDDMSFARHGATIGASYGITKDLRIFLRTSYDRIYRYNKLAVLTDNLDYYLKNGGSNHFDVGTMIAYDSRSGHQMPNDGHSVHLGVSGTFKTKASNYKYIKLVLAHQSNIQLFSPVHILRISTFLGGIWGDAPFFEKFFFNDFYDLAPSRIGVLNPSSRGAFDIFGTGAKSLSYEDFLARLSLSYAWQPLEQRVEFFGLVSAIWANSDKVSLIQIANKNYKKPEIFPVDMSFNLGVRMRTEYGLFSLTLAHIFNLIPR